MTTPIQEDILYYLKLLVKNVDQDFDIETEKEGDQYRINIITTKEDEVSGKDGEFLKSVQHIIRTLIHKKNPHDKTHFLFDINNLKKKRETAISKKIPNLAENEVLSQGNTIILVGLSGYERLQVHRILSEIKGLNTTSVGPDDNRKLLVMPTSDIGSMSMDKAKIINVKDLG